MTFIGISAYAIMSPSFPYKKLLRCFPINIERPALAVLFGTFGNRVVGIRAFCDKYADRKHLVEVHISNECSRRTGRQGNQIAADLGVGAYDKALRTESRPIKSEVRARVDEVIDRILPATNVNTVLMLSPGLESDLGSSALTVLHKVVSARSKNLPIIYSPNGHANGYYGATYIESHSTTPNSTANIWNIDGTSLDFGDGEQYKPKITPTNFLRSFRTNGPGKKAVFLWSAFQQGLSGIGLGAGYDDRTFVVTANAITGMRGLLKEMQSILT